MKPYTRRQTCHILAGITWGGPQNCHLPVNTTQWTPAELAEPVDNFAKNWFDKIPDSAG